MTVITVGVDGSAGGRRALAWAVRHALAAGATVEVVTAYRPDPLDYGVEGHPEGVDLNREFTIKQQQLDVCEVLSRIPGSHPVVTQRVAEGDPVDVLIAAARAADLLVLGSHGRGQLATTLLGSVSEACIRRGSTPVLVVPAHDRTTRPAAATRA